MNISSFSFLITKVACKTVGICGNPMKLYKTVQIMRSIFLFLLDLSCSSLPDVRDSEEVTKALKTAVGSKQVHIPL